MKRLYIPMTFLLLGIMGLSCGGYRPPVILEPEQQWAMAEFEYNKKSYSKAIEQYKTFLSHHRGHAKAEEAAFKMGMCYFKMEDYILATSRFQYFLKTFPFSSLGDEAQYRIGLCYWEQKNSRDYDQTSIEKGLSAFDQIINTYPKSRWTPDAIVKAKECRNILANKMYRAGYFYQKSKKYLSAIIYYNQVLKDYSNTDYANWSYFRKGQCLMFLGYRERGEQQINLALTLTKDNDLKHEIMNFLNEQ